jgi:hypothetical protein
MESGEGRGQRDYTLALKVSVVGQVGKDKQAQSAMGYESVNSFNLAL